MTTEQRYTLTEARQELNRRHCATHGHDINVLSAGLNPEPFQLVCDCCGKSWKVQPTREEA